jgi:DNA-binding Lrp family transcriptional regulator
MLKQKKMTQYDLAQQIGRFDFVERVDIVSGGTDMVAIVRVEGVDEFDKILLGKLQTAGGHRQDPVAYSNTREISGKQRTVRLIFF